MHLRRTGTDRRWVRFDSCEMEPSCARLLCAASKDVMEPSCPIPCANIACFTDDDRDWENGTVHDHEDGGATCHKLPRATGERRRIYARYNCTTTTTYAQGCERVAGKREVAQVRQSRARLQRSNARAREVERHDIGPACKHLHTKMYMDEDTWIDSVWEHVGCGYLW